MTVVSNGYRHFDVQAQTGQHALNKNKQLCCERFRVLIPRKDDFLVYLYSEFMAFLIVAFIVGVVLLVKWLQRCPRCKSMIGPKGVPGSGRLLPDYQYKVKRMCRKCGHTWEEKDRYDYDL